MADRRHLRRDIDQSRPRDSARPRPSASPKVLARSRTQLPSPPWKRWLTPGRLAAEGLLVSSVQRLTFGALNQHTDQLPSDDPLGQRRSAVSAEQAIGTVASESERSSRWS